MLDDFLSKFRNIQVSGRSRFLPGAISANAYFSRYEKNPEMAGNEVYDAVGFFPKNEYHVNSELDVIASEKGAVFGAFDLSKCSEGRSEEIQIVLKSIMEREHPNYDFEFVQGEVALDIANYDKPGDPIETMGNSTHILLVRNYEEIAKANKLAAKNSKRKVKKAKNKIVA